MRIGMTMLSTTGGSSVVATGLAVALREHGFGVRLLHCGGPDTDGAAGTDGAADIAAPVTALSTEPARYLQRSLDVDRAFCGTVDLCTQLLDWYQQAPFELLHIHNIHIFGIAALMLKRVHGVPFVVTFHGSDVLDDRMMARSALIVREVLAEAAGVSCVSRYLAAALVRAQAVEPRVIFNFLRGDFPRGDLGHGDLGHGDLHRAPGSSAGPPRILHVSSLREVKRPELLLASFAAFLAREPGAVLRIATTRRGRQRAAELGDAFALGDALTVIDTEAHPDRLHDEYREASALLLTSRYESFGLVMLEALACGVAVVAPALGGIPEVLGADWPFLVKDVDQPAAYAAALALAVAPGARRHAQEAARQLLDRFTPEASVRGYVQLYRDALRPQPGAR